MRYLAPAKINPFLSVGARRADGLHEIVSVMQAVSLSDTVSLEPAPALSISVAPPDAAPADETNLAARAARSLAGMHGLEPAVAIEIRKRIPAAAGLAGGSADAAATLLGLKAVWDLRVSRKALERIGAGLGADVPFCIRGGTAVARGAGEDLAVLSCPEPVWWVLGFADEGLSTGAVYDEYDRLGAGAVGDPYEVADALARGDLDRLGAALRNDLQTAAISLRPSLAKGADALSAAGAMAVLLSGSGPTWLGLARDEAYAHAVAAEVARGFARVEVVHSLRHGPKEITRV